MFWTDECPETCNQCLDVIFERYEKDTACLKPIHDTNNCLFGGNFLRKITQVGQVVVSSSECLKSGTMTNIQVIKKSLVRNFGPIQLISKQCHLPNFRNDMENIEFLPNRHF